MMLRTRLPVLVIMPLLSLWTGAVLAGDSAADMAKKLQNPLASIKAVMSDNAIGFNTGDDAGTSYGFQVQPVYAVDLPDQGLTLIPRASIPITGLEPGTRAPIVGEDGKPTPPGTDRVWGLGDSILQLFIAPHLNSDWKWGIGPQLSIPTHTSKSLAGPEWGAGITGVIVGDITPQLNLALLLSNHWSFDGDFNTLAIQPMLFYNFASVPGAFLTYNTVISADWKADSRNRWTVPLGLSIGRTFDVGQGNGLDLMIGPYYNVVRPDGAADWSIRFGIGWLFP